MFTISILMFLTREIFTLTLVHIKQKCKYIKGFSRNFLTTYNTVANCVNMLYLSIHTLWQWTYFMVVAVPCRGAR